jgi:hypothetical protein
VFEEIKQQIEKIQKLALERARLEQEHRQAYNREYKRRLQIQNKPLLPHYHLN